MAETLNIRTGDMRWPITIQAPNASERDAYGEPISADWTTIWTCRAFIQSTQTATYKASTGQDALTSQATYIMTIRWPGSTQITPDMRILFQNQPYQVNVVNNVLQANRFLQIYCMRIDS